MICKVQFLHQESLTEAMLSLEKDRAGIQAMISFSFNFSSGFEWSVFKQPNVVAITVMEGSYNP